ncbi:LytR/AlgR family response regulator transcription factor [Pseudidiomarina aestuarii]|uniref:LytR/AlgR family response regulator transcription factor n=1 Tax=Pseudidiomarina aestuarii TaxID=624146 RepID=UPI001FCE733F|nr:LytTR family DNA-binding domain-containing protein [Pseudidiomarina aestuarii]
MKVLIVDDEPLAHDVLLHYIKEHQEIAVVGQCYSATEALTYLAHHQVDLMFVDIKMPGLSGLDMLRVMANKPQVILCTAFQEYAIEGFELDVTDYLLKPVRAERFAQAIEKVRQRILSASSASERQSLILRVDREDRKLWLDSIECFESYGNFVKVWQDQQCCLTNGPLKALAEKLPSEDFMQVHKSVLVNKAHIIARDTISLTLKSGRKVPIGKSFKADLADLW